MERDNRGEETGKKGVYPVQVKTAEQYELEIWLLKKDLEFWRTSVNVNIIVKQNEKIRQLEDLINELAKQ